MRNLSKLLVLTASFAPLTVFASGSYEFCVFRASTARSENLHVSFKYGDIDPTKEVARVVVSQRMREADTTSVSVSDYNKTSCPGPDVTEITVSASLDQVQRIINALGKGDVAGAAVGAADVAAGATVSVVKGAGGVLQSIGNGVKHVICGIFHC